jgi:hypothetical protein
MVKDTSSLSTVLQKKIFGHLATEKIKRMRQEKESMKRVMSLPLNLIKEEGKRQENLDMLLFLRNSNHHSPNVLEKVQSLIDVVSLPREMDAYMNNLMSSSPAIYGSLMKNGEEKEAEKSLFREVHALDSKFPTKKQTVLSLRTFTEMYGDEPGNQRKERPYPHLPSFSLGMSSSILTPGHFSLLFHHIPFRLQSLSLYLIYSRSVDGISLQTVFHKCESFLNMHNNLNRERSILMVLKESEGVIFGAYLTNSFHTSDRYYGERECFVWRFVSDDSSANIKCASKEGSQHVEEKKGCLMLESFFSTRKNSYYIYCCNNITIGGGGVSGGNTTLGVGDTNESERMRMNNPGWAIFLSSDMEKGSSYCCETFDSPPLLALDGNDSIRTSFELTAFEIWGFQKGV